MLVYRLSLNYVFRTAPFAVLLIFSDSLEQLLQNTDVRFTDFLHYLNTVKEL